MGVGTHCIILKRMFIKNCCLICAYVYLLRNKIIIFYETIYTRFLIRQLLPNIIILLILGKDINDIISDMVASYHNIIMMLRLSNLRN